MPFSSSETTNAYDLTLKALQDAHHSQCLFQHNPPVDDLHFGFSEDGVLKGRFAFSAGHQGYDGIVHGGVIASIIDASMAQCCMGHGLVAYTGDLSIRYRNPVRIAMPTFLETRIVRKALGVLFSLECGITQEGSVNVEATGRFFKVPANK